MTWASLFISLAVFPSLVYSRCECPIECSCDDHTVECSGLREIPNCLPNRPEEVLISASRKLTIIREHAFDDTSYFGVEKLSIRGASLETIENHAFVGLSSLKELEIVGADDLTEISQITFTGLSRVETLVIERCFGLERIAYSAFSSMSNLERLILRNNGIENIEPDALASIRNLKYFDISENPSLQSIPRNLLLDISTLKEIRINDCSLSTLYPEFFMASHQSGNLERIEAAGNNWNCDDDMCSLVQWLSANNQVRYWEAHFGYCIRPRELSGFDLTRLIVSDVCERDSSNLFRYLGIAVGCLVFLFVFVAACCRGTSRRRHHSQYPNAAQREVRPTDNTPLGNAYVISPHGQAAVQSPDPPIYEEALNAPVLKKSDKPLPVPFDDIPPPPYEA